MNRQALAKELQDAWTEFQQFGQHEGHCTFGPSCETCGTPSGTCEHHQSAMQIRTVRLDTAIRQVVESLQREPLKSMNYDLVEHFLKRNGIGASTWLELEGLEVYVRKRRRLLPNREAAITVLDIANITVPEPFRGQKRFTNLLTEIEQNAAAHVDGIYIESLLNPRLGPFFERRGYTPRLVGNVMDYYLVFEKG